MNIFNVTASQVNASSASQQFKKVYEYSLQVMDRSGDVQKLTASFTSIPSASDWTNWLSGWLLCGYSLSSKPQLISVI